MILASPTTRPRVGMLPNTHDAHESSELDNFGATTPLPALPSGRGDGRDGKPGPEILLAYIILILLGPGLSNRTTTRLFVYSYNIPMCEAQKSGP